MSLWVFAAKKGYWALDHEAFDSIRDFMQSLCAAIIRIRRHLATVMECIVNAG